MFATNSVELGNDDQLISELLAIQARPLAGGGVRIAAASGRDDIAHALAACADTLLEPVEATEPVYVVAQAAGRSY